MTYVGRFRLSFLTDVLVPHRREGKLGAQEREPAAHVRQRPALTRPIIVICKKETKKTSNLHPHIKNKCFHKRLSLNQDECKRYNKTFIRM